MSTFRSSPPPKDAKAAAQALASVRAGTASQSQPSHAATLQGVIAGPGSLRHADVLHLSRTAGNGAVSHLLGRGGRSRVPVQRMPIKGSSWKTGIADKTRYEALVATGKKMDEATGIEALAYKTSTSDLTVEELIELKAMLEGGNKTFISSEDIAKIGQEIQNRSDPVWIEEQARKAQERKDNQEKTEARLLARGRDLLGGSGETWAKREKEIEAWFERMKDLQLKETWATVFKANRMSARQIGVKGQNMGGTFSIRNKHEPTNKAREREVTLDRGASGIDERMKPDNFYNPKTKERGKNAKGLHDLSASLLDATKKPPSIIAQLKPYANSIVLFMPVPTEDDMQIFNAVMHLHDPNLELLRLLKAKMTRIKLAQGSDMHTTLYDVSASPDSPAMVRYGATGRVQRGKGEDEVAADETDIAARKTNALEHSVILKGGAMQKINEIVMAYRSQSSQLFPLYAEWDPGGRRFWVLDRSKARTATYITDQGAWIQG